MSEERKLPEGWRRTHLGEVASISKDKLEPENFNGLPYISLEHIESNTTRIIKYGDSSGVKSTKGKFQSGDVLYGRLRPYLNKVCIPDRDGVCSTDILIFRESDSLNNRFLLKYLSTPRVTEYAKENSKGINLPRINWSALSELPIDLPPLPEQKRIVAKIESLQERSRAAKGHLEQIPDLLNKLRQSVLAAAFRGDLTKEWRAKNPNTEPATELLKRIKKERRTKWEQQQLANYKAKGKQPPKNWKEKYKEPAPVDTDGLPELPGGWCWARVKELGEVTLGRQRAPKYHSGDNMRSYLRVKNVFEDRIDISDVMKMDFSGDEFEKFRLVHGDILLNEGQSLELVGRPAMFNGEIEDVCFTNTLVRFRAYQQVLPRFALYLFLLYLKNGRFMQIASWSTNIAHLGAGRFAELEFSLPPIDEQQEIVTLLDKVSLSIENVKSRREDMHKQVSFLEHGMLAKAFRGELVVLG